MTKVVIYIEGGAITDIMASDNVDVCVVDYDSEGFENTLEIDDQEALVSINKGGKNEEKVNEVFKKVKKHLKENRPKT